MLLVLLRNLPLIVYELLILVSIICLDSFILLLQIIQYYQNMLQHMSIFIIILNVT